MKRMVMVLLLLVAALPARSAFLDDPVICTADDGIEVVSLRLTAAGTMVDLRLRVTDADKAKRVLDGAHRPLLLVKGSDKVLGVPAPAKIGPLKATSGKLEAGRTYFVMFGNPARMLRASQAVDLRFGPYLIPNLVVEG